MSNLDVLLIRGAPGIGKTTVGEMLRTLLVDGVVIDVDDVRRMVNKDKFVYGENVDYINAVRASCSLAESFIALGYRPIVIVDVFSISVLEVACNCLKGTSIISISLHCNESVLVGRMLNRKNGYVNTDVAKKVNEHILATLESTNVSIDTTVLSPGELVERIMNSLSTRRD
jgi:broad-specificity NMP kinase